MLYRHHVAFERLLQSFSSVDLPQTPTNFQNPSPDEAYQAPSITSSCKPDQASILPALGSQELPRDWYTSQAAEAHHSVQTRVPSSKDFSPAQLSYTDRRETDVASRGEAEEDTEDNQLSDTSATILWRAG